MTGDDASDLTTLEGTLEHVVFANERNHWTVARFHIHADDETRTIVGTLPHIKPGEVLRISGRESVHEKFGPQFKVEAFQAVTPTTVEGMRRYLATGVLAGMGKVLADRLVDRFGADTLTILEESPERLLEVEGIGKKKLKSILASWEATQAARETLVFLRGHGFGPAIANRIWEMYRHRAIAIVREQPYRVARDVEGVGFAMADRIARSVGLPEDDPDRLAAGLVHVLRDRSNEGHVAFPWSLLVERAAVLLSIDPLVVDAALDELVKAGQVRSERVPASPDRTAATTDAAAESDDPDAGDPDAEGDAVADAHADADAINPPSSSPCYAADFADDFDGATPSAPFSRFVYTPPLHEAETQVAGRLKQLMQGASAIGADALRHLDAAGRFGGIELTDEQLAAVRLALTNKISIITGGPGVGKTTIVRTIVSVTRRVGLRVELAAPTGRAAKRLTEATGVGARTIHRMLEFDPSVGSFQRGADNPIEADLILIDETSMVDIVLARELLWALPRDANLVLIGDADQLPSVGPGRVLGDLLDSRSIPQIRLARVFRQVAGGGIVENAHRINQGDVPLAAPSETADFHLVVREDPVGAANLVEMLVTERIPKRFGLDPIADVQVLTPMYRGDCGADALNARLQEKLNPGVALVKRGRLELKINDRVMQVANDYDKGVFNGDVGRVIDVAGDTVHVDVDGKDVVYKHEELDALTLAYAVTVHKAQGSEYPAVVIPLTTAHWPLLQRNLLYTAVTRGKRLVVIVGSRRAIRRAVANGEVGARYGLLARRIRQSLDAPLFAGEPAVDLGPSDSSTPDAASPDDVPPGDVPPDVEASENEPNRAEGDGDD